jgi:AraC-like DNA-binding protein
MDGPETDWVTAAPHPALAPYVERYVGYRMRGFPPGLHRGLPSRYMTFIASIGPTIDVVAQTDPAQPPDRYRCVVSGLAASSAVIEHTGHQEGVAIELTPLGSRALFGVPLRAMRNTSVELAAVVGRPGDRLWERLQDDAPWPARFAACDDELGRLVDDAEMSPELLRAWDVMTSSEGTAPVHEVARDVGWSRQHFAKRFTDEFGLGPKVAARVMRFENARNLMRDVPSFVSVAQVAAVCGYYDQAHLNRDFVELAGCSPTEWMCEELPSFQDRDALDISC